jgi:hypothetical protein
MPAFPNLLKTRFGRLFGFFMLYMAEGLPQGYTGTAVALEFKRMGMTSAAIGTFAATHFTACMVLLNLGTVLCYWWQGQAITSLANGGWGFTYLQIFLLDAAVGSLFLLILPFMKPSPPSADGV